ncbi:MAG TPA: 2-octaprenyl-6-methoxyphenyl hydroxylase [Steroidobacteraceae bacterium]|jgi:2-octaprenyl-6-methoxyphenol hydroxylase|nr:2-octaprenyl-6-methoxyphenyl hydroxylase [Steroidobacteraceae bacterium]
MSRGVSRDVSAGASGGADGVNAAAARSCEVAIVGGGMVGASLALALAGTGRQLVLIEAVEPHSAAQPSFDERTTALGNGARRIFETLGVWDAIATQAAPIRHIHVSDAGHFGFARLEAAAHELPAFGYTVSNRHLGRVLWQALRERGGIELLSPARLSAVALAPDAAILTVQQGPPAPHEQGHGHGETLTLRARLAVAADGAHSLVKQAAGIASSSTDYQQVALVANLRTDSGAQAIAYERFTDTGPLALLPRHDGGYAMIWTVAPAAAGALLACSESEFRDQLQRRFGWRAGRIQQVGARASYPLSLVQAHSSVGARTALIGNASQALHPIAAQGFNLGLRDAAVLAELIAAAEDPGADAVLAQFARRRAPDRRGMVGFTDRLVKLFSDQRGAVAAARDLGLLLFDVSMPAKRALSRLSWGFGALPRLSRGLPLPPRPAQAQAQESASAGARRRGRD